MQVASTGDLIKKGWVKKKIQHHLFHPYSNRFLYLSSTSLLYFHNDEELGSDSADCNIPLHAIDNVSVGRSRGVFNAEELLLTIDSGDFVCVLIFLCPGKEAVVWAQAIIKARQDYLIKFPSPVVNVVWRRHATRKSISGKVSGAVRKMANQKIYVKSDYFNEEQISALIQ